MKDILIIKHLRKGNEAVFKYIYEHHYVLLCRIANQILSDTALSEEIVNDVIFYLWEYRHEVEITHSIRAYLIRSVRNRCLNELKSLRYRREKSFSSFITLESIEFLDTIFIDENQPLGILLEQELEQELIQSIEELPIECRTVFKKSRFEQKKYKEIAIELGVSINTVKYHMKNALAILQKRMDDYLHIIILYFFIGF